MDALLKYTKQPLSTANFGVYADNELRKIELAISGIVTRLTTPLVWTPVTFLNAWTNFGAGYAPAEYTKDALDRVYIRGLITGGANGTVAFNLPAGYRPSSAGHLNFPSNDNNVAAQTLGRIDVLTNGNVLCIAPNANHLTLQISFYAEA